MKTIYQVDAFTAEPFKGNPAAVMILDAPMPDDWMQKVAREMNLSETAFLVRVENGFNLRWFTPSVEVELCGHATLASAHTLWETGTVDSSETIIFHTLSGELSAEKNEGMIVLDFPVKPETQATGYTELADIIGVVPVYVGKSQFDLIAELPSHEDVLNVKPDLARLNAIKVRGLIVTAQSSDRNYDFISRFFAPGAGVDEDPVTGSAHCCLAPYWSGKTGKTDMTGYQASARGGVVKVRLEGDRVKLMGYAVTVMKGELYA